jgi:hypothetical protein
MYDAGRSIFGWMVILVCRMVRGRDAHIEECHCLYVRFLSISAKHPGGHSPGDQNNLTVLDLLNPTGEVFQGEGAKIVVSFIQYFLRQGAWLHCPYLMVTHFFGC